MQSLYSLTAIRFFAALVVVLFHFGQSQFAATPGFISKIVQNGYIGVQLFFILSGFILAYTYFPQQNWTNINFWRARFARVYPVYFVALLLALPIFLGIVARDGESWSFAGLTTVLTGTLVHAWFPNSACALNCPSWSLSVEAFFYLLFPFLAIPLIRAKIQQLVIWGIIAVLSILIAPIIFLLILPEAITASSSTKAVWMEFLRYNPLLHLGEFVLGITLGGIFLKAPKIQWGNMIAGLGIVLTLLILMSDAVPYVLLHNGIFAIPFAMLIYGLAHAQGIIASLSKNNTLLLLGQASYAFYILHAPIFVYTKYALARFGISHESWLFLGLYLTLLTSVSVAAFYIIEDPARKWLKSRFKSHQKLKTTI